MWSVGVAMPFRGAADRGGEEKQGEGKEGGRKGEREGGMEEKRKEGRMEGEGVRTINTVFLIIIHAHVQGISLIVIM